MGVERLALPSAHELDNLQPRARFHRSIFPIAPAHDGAVQLYRHARRVDFEVTQKIRKRSPGWDSARIAVDNYFDKNCV